MTEIKEDAKKIEEGLSRNPLFNGLDDFYLRDIIARAEVRTWPDGIQIITEGEAGDAGFFILRGGGTAAFVESLSRPHKVYMGFFAYLPGRLREATRKIGGLALLDVCGRIAHTLMGRAKGGGGTNEKGISIESPTHQG